MKFYRLFSELNHFNQNFILWLLTPNRARSAFARNIPFLIFRPRAASTFRARVQRHAKNDLIQLVIKIASDIIKSRIADGLRNKKIIENSAYKVRNGQNDGRGESADEEEEAIWDSGEGAPEHPLRRRRVDFAEVLETVSRDAGFVEMVESSHVSRMFRTNQLPVELYRHWMYLMSCKKFYVKKLLDVGEVLGIRNSTSDPENLGFGGPSGGRNQQESLLAKRGEMDNEEN